MQYTSTYNIITDCHKKKNLIVVSTLKYNVLTARESFTVRYILKFIRIKYTAVFFFYDLA